MGLWPAPSPDHVVPPHTGRGRRPELSDSELISLAVAQVLLGYHRERRWIRSTAASGAPCSPTCSTQSGYHKRLKNAEPLLCKAILTPGHLLPPSWFDDMWITDATPVPCGMSRETVKRSGPGRTRRVRLLRLPFPLLLGTEAFTWCAPATGCPIMWCLANPKIGEREVLAALLEHNHHLIRDGADPAGRQGLRRQSVQQLTDAMGLRLLRPDRKDETYRNGNLGGVRQWIESVNQTLKGQLDLENATARAPWPGVFTRVAQRLLAMAAGIWHN